MDLKSKLESLPHKPGIYLMKDRWGRVIYVGKAKSLRNRVRSYFQNGADLHPRISAMIKKVSDLDSLVTDSEMEALILESNLIKEYKPRYNVNLKDDKRYPFLKVTVDENFPRILVVRRAKKDKAKYFGPYTNVKGMRKTLRLLRRIFPVRSCNFAIPSKKASRLCLDYHIKRCQGPCVGLVSQKDYNDMIRDVSLFLSGKNSFLIDQLKRKMNEYSQKEKFEEAARIRDQIKALESVMQTQKVVETEKKDRDIIAFARSGKDISLSALQVREGVLIGRQQFHLTSTFQTPDEEILSSFLRQYYMHSAIIPEEIILPARPEDLEMIKRWLAKRREGKVEVIVPQKGKKHNLLEMAGKNAQLLLEEMLLQKSERKKKVPEIVLRLKNDLYLDMIPREIAAFDISNLGTSDAAGSLVFFSDGKPKKSEYKRFKIKTVEGQDDFAMMKEVVKRYFSRLIQEEKRFPDLVLVDGGKGQLSSALEALSSLGIKNQSVIGLAKRLDEVFLPERSDPLMIKKDSLSLRLVQRIRDEAHRFAINYHKVLRKKRTIKSELDQIKGIGGKRKEALLKYFGSVKRIKAASMEELTRAEGITPKLAEKIYDYFQR
jgi:excinuclease ABC subunit C